MPAIVTGNALLEGDRYRGWVLGHFVRPLSDPRSTDQLEIKLTTHCLGDRRSGWSLNQQATSLSILVQGRFRILFLESEVLLGQPGDYALWLPQVPHCWTAEAESTIVTVRWPSVPGDSIEVELPATKR